MRSEQAFKNMVANLFLQVIVFASGIILPRFFLEAYGSNINGMITSINQFLAYLGLAEAGVGITGAVAALADGTGIQEKHSEMVSVMVMMPVSVMDSGKDGMMTAGQADLVVLDGRMEAVDAAEFNIGGFMPPIILPSII